MKAVRIHEYGGPDKLLFEDNVPEPSLPPGSVLIQALAASVNPIDWKIRSGTRQKDFPMALPAILGRDVSGTIRAVGAGVANFKVGEAVVAMTVATYAERVAVDAADVAHLPHGVNVPDAAALPLISLTGTQLVTRAAGVQAGQTVLVTGALGSVGRAAVHSAKKLGARVIAGVRKAQLDAAAALGAADTVAIDDDAAIAKLRALDAVADTVGGATAAKLFAAIKPGGRLGYASVLPDGCAERHPSVTVTRVFARSDASKVREFADDWRDGKFVLPIARRLTLRDAAEAHRLAEQGGTGKILLLSANA